MSFVDRCVTTVEYVRIVHRSRLLDWIKSCCYIERYSPLDLFEPASGIIRIPQHNGQILIIKTITWALKLFPVVSCYGWQSGA